MQGEPIGEGLAVVASIGLLSGDPQWRRHGAADQLKLREFEGKSATIVGEERARVADAVVHQDTRASYTS